MAKNIYVTRRGDTWAVVRENNLRASRIVSTQSEAINIAKDYAKKDCVELRIHDRNGKFRKTMSYGSDPCPPLDRNF